MNKTNATNPLYRGKSELGVAEFIAYCLVSTIICFFLAWGLVSHFFMGTAFHQDFVSWSFFLAIVPGFLIGAIIYNTQRHNATQQTTPTPPVNPPMPPINQETTQASHTTSISDKLIELKKLRDQDLITLEEFDKMKKEILKNLR